MDRPQEKGWARRAEVSKQVAQFPSVKEDISFSLLIGFEGQRVEVQLINRESTTQPSPSYQPF